MVADKFTEVLIKLKSNACTYIQKCESNPLLTTWIHISWCLIVFHIPYYHCTVAIYCITCIFHNFFLASKSCWK